MPLPKEKLYTSDEFINLFPEQSVSELKELIEGEIVEMSAPSILHQKISIEVSSEIRNYIKENKGSCSVFTAPFDVKLDNYNLVMPDISVICDESKLSNGKRCNGSPDWIIEIVSSNWRDDYIKKLDLYQRNGVREYWVIDPNYQKTLVYFFDERPFPSVYTFEMPIPVGIYKNKAVQLSINVAELIK